MTPNEFLVIAIQQPEVWRCPKCEHELTFYDDRTIYDNVFCGMIENRCPRCVRTWIAEHFPKMEKVEEKGAQNVAVR